MKPKTNYVMIKRWYIVVATLIAVGGCSGAGTGRIHTSVGLGFYHSSFGHGWGNGYYRGYDRGVIDAADTIDAIDASDAIDSMGMPDMDMELGPDIDFDF